MASAPIISWQIEEEKVKTMTDFIFLISIITVDGNCNHEIKRYLYLGEESYDKPPIHRTKMQRNHFTDKGLYSQSYYFSSSHIQM